MALPPDLIIRHPLSQDHPRIISVMKDWWGGRDLTAMIPRLFLNHFNNTSFVVEKTDALVGFLIGFLSPQSPNEGYIHFAGVDPAYHGQGIGTVLYQQFFQLCRAEKRLIIRSCTSPVNNASIAFHTRLGFLISKGDMEIDGVSVSVDYNKPGDSKVLFEKRLEA